MKEDRAICYITVSYPFGGGEAFVGPEINEWVHRGYSVRIIPLRPRGVLQSNCLASGVWMPIFRLTYVFSMLRWLWRTPRAFFGAIRDILCMPRKLPKNIIAGVKAFAVADELVGTSIGHIHAHWGGTSSTMAMVVSRLTGIPWSLTCHRWDIYENNLLRIKSERARFVRFISERGKVDAVSLGARPDKSIVVHMGVDLSVSRYEARTVRAHPRLVCAANLIEVKGHRYLIEALQLLRANGSEATLDLCGDGPGRQALVAQCGELGLTDVVSFLGHIPHQQLLEALGNGDYDLLVLPSIEISASLHEGIPVSLLEAMSCGVPVVSTKTGSISELLPDCLEVTVPDRDPGALAEAMRGVLCDYTRYVTLSKTMRRMIMDGWQISSMVDSLEKLIEKS